MRNTVSFFAKYYFKKHIGRFIFNQTISDNDIFWKRYFRTARKIPISIESVSADEHVITVLSISYGNRKVHVRSAGSSDMQVFNQIFLEEEYQPMINLVQNHVKTHPVKFIIDAGANVGYTSLLLSAAFPGSNLICIEPNSLNARQMKKQFLLNNTLNCQIIEAGVWSKNCWLSLKCDDIFDGDWSCYVVESETETDLKAFTLKSIMEKYEWPYIDILKIDIEGSEEQLFNDGEAMKKILLNTRFVAIEIHDALCNRENIYSVLRSAGFDWFESRELTIATNKKFLYPKAVY